MTSRTIRQTTEPVSRADLLAQEKQTKREYNRRYYMKKLGPDRKALHKRQRAAEVIDWLESQMGSDITGLEKRLLERARREFVSGRR